MNCPNCGIKDIEVEAQVYIVARLNEILGGKLFDIRDRADYMWCHSCSHGVKLTESGELVTYLSHIDRTPRASKPIDKEELIKVLRSMSKEDVAKLLEKGGDIGNGTTY